MFDSVRPSAREGGIKYFYLSAFSSGLMIYGIFLLFTSLGTGQFQEMNQALIANFGSLVLKEISIRFGILFLLIGIFFKLSAFPGHLWAAEIYEGSSDPVMAFFMVPVKVAMLAFTIQLLAVGLSSVASL
jgi:NADH-quinone oxidoreductase subunit N